MATTIVVHVGVVPQVIEAQKNNRIQVSNTKKTLFFYVNLAKRYIQQHNEVERFALGMAITTVVTIAQILKNNGLATKKKYTVDKISQPKPAFAQPISKVETEQSQIWVAKFIGLFIVVNGKVRRSRRSSSSNQIW
ncbi:hypothetical protein UlMin_038059 [Ulmus minor]